MRVLFLLLTSLIGLIGCGIKSEIPSSSTQPSQSERAVSIGSMVVDSGGTTITCELNEAIVGPGVEIPVFIEFEGTQVERVVTENQESYTFSSYDPPSQGDILCVVEFANAEFESEARTISPSD